MSARTAVPRLAAHVADEPSGDRRGGRAISQSEKADLAKAVALPLLVLITASGLLFGLYDLGAQPLWLDEAISVAIASSPIRLSLRLAIGREPSMLLYYLLLKCWLWLGHGPFFARLFSTLFATASVPLLYALGAKLFSRRIALSACALLAVNTSLIAYAQEARSYTLTVCLVLASWLMMLEVVRTSSRPWKIGYILATSLAVYSQTLALLIVPAQVTASPFADSHRKGFKVLHAAVLFTLVFSIPAVLLVVASGIAHNFNWIPGTSLHDVASTLSMMAGAFDAPRPLRLALDVSYGSAVLFSFGWVITYLKYRTGLDSGVIIASAAFFLPIVLLFAGSVIRPMYVTRYVLICLPFFALLAAAGLVRALPAKGCAAALALLVGMSLVSDVAYYRYSHKPQAWADAMRYMAAGTLPGDQVIVTPSYCRCPFEYSVHHDRDAFRSVRVIYPEDDAPLYDYSAEMSAAKWSSNYDRLWIVSCDSMKGADIANRFAGRAQRSTMRAFPGVSVSLLENVAPVHGNN